MGATILQLHKRSSYEYKFIQDKYTFNKAEKTFALSDGTTQSFKSEIWADMITKCFVENPTFKTDKLIQQFKEKAKEFQLLEFEYSPNPAKASLEKTKQKNGGTATFIGMQFRGENELDIICCGDSNIFLIEGANLRSSYPYEDLDSLDANSNFINTELLCDNKLSPSKFSVTTLSLANLDSVLVATDALSRLILKKPDVIKELLRIETFDQLLKFCMTNWDKKELEEDDISAMIIPNAHFQEVTKIVPDMDFSFPKEIEMEFLPTTNKKKDIRKFTDMEFNEIRNNFNGVAQDFYQVKKKLKLNEVLMLLTISLLIANLMLSYIFRPRPSDADAKEIVKLEKSLKQKNKEIKGLNQKINGLEAELKQLKPNTKEKEPEKETNESPSNPPKIGTLSKAEAFKRQMELIEAGYKITADSIWGPTSEKNWNEYQKKKSKK